MVEKQEPAAEFWLAGKWVVPSSGELTVLREAKHCGPCFKVMEREPQMSFDQGSNEIRALLLRIILTAQWKVG